MKQTTKSPQALALLAGVMSNPLTTIPLGIAAIGVGALVYSIKKSRGEDEQRVPNRSEPVQNTLTTVQNEPFEPYNERYEETVHEPSGTDQYEMTDEEYKKELVRQAMSELGKKSGEARRRKRDILAEQQ